jgi:hypothetical protein
MWSPQASVATLSKCAVEEKEAMISNIALAAVFSGDRKHALKKNQMCRKFHLLSTHDRCRSIKSRETDRTSDVGFARPCNEAMRCCTYCRVICRSRSQIQLEVLLEVLDLRRHTQNFGTKATVLEILSKSSLTA